jgi:TonB C terminal
MVQAGPELRAFLKKMAVNINQNWQQRGRPALPYVVASFDNTKQRWIVQSNEEERQAASRAAKLLVSNVLNKNVPPGIKPLKIFFYFNSSRYWEAAGKGQDVDFGPYSRWMDNKIKSNWQDREIPGLLKAKVKYVLASNGAISKVAVTSPSGDKGFDAAALRALSLSSPFLPLPLVKDGLEIECNFIVDEISKAMTNRPPLTRAYRIDLAQPEVASWVNELNSIESW